MMCSKKSLWVLLLLLISFSTLADIQLNRDEALKIGIKIWHNESDNRVAGLTSWNPGEDFASVGIGHFVWYPSQRHSHFVGTFPALIYYMKQRGVKVPAWLDHYPTPPCPWPDRDAFLLAEQSEKMKELRQFFLETIDIQAEFIVHRAKTTLKRLLKNTPYHQHANIKKQFYRLTQSPQGIYAIIDYVNFKGEGLGKHEHYHHQGWGLLQVFQLMRYAPKRYTPTQAFVWSANKALLRRVHNAPLKRNEYRWLKGWQKRLESYL